MSHNEVVNAVLKRIAREAESAMQIFRSLETMDKANNNANGSFWKSLKSKLLKRRFSMVIAKPIWAMLTDLDINLYAKLVRLSQGIASSKVYRTLKRGAATITDFSKTSATTISLLHKNKNKPTIVENQEPITIAGYTDQEVEDIIELLSNTPAAEAKRRLKCPQRTEKMIPVHTKTAKERTKSEVKKIQRRYIDSVTLSTLPLEDVPIIEIQKKMEDPEIAGEER
ncbi:hypothetical protein Ciccas_004633 [Cichlidogyrus casuarinus]|uniref:Uncharacterized protein n=1 Tax=Cichlidogyrus casuarinus TaxID=1844966 RepID=A0ABD2QAY2_9PLAT